MPIWIKIFASYLSTLIKRWLLDLPLIGKWITPTICKRKSFMAKEMSTRQIFFMFPLWRGLGLWLRATGQRKMGGFLKRAMSINAVNSILYSLWYKLRSQVNILKFWLPLIWIFFGYLFFVSFFLYLLDIYLTFTGTVESYTALVVPNNTRRPP